MYYSTHKFFKSHAKSSQVDLLHSSVLLVPVHSVRVLPPLLSSLEILLTYTSEERTCIAGNTCHVITTYSCVTSPRTRKTQLPLLLRNLATDCLPRVCLRGNSFTNSLPCKGCTYNNIYDIKKKLCKYLSKLSYNQQKLRGIHIDICNGTCL
jgi:hypothetical protein